MIYSDLYQRKQAKVPSLVAILVIGVISFFMTQFLLTPATPTNAVKRNIISMQVANIGSNRAVIVWRTTNKEPGMVLWGTKPSRLTTIAIDERDSSKTRTPFFNHSVTLTGLAASTRYYYSISNTKELLETAKTTVFSFSTTPNDTRINSLQPVYGTVTSTSGIMEKNVLVIFNYPGAYPLATLSKNSGEWLLPLNGLTSKKGNNLIAPAVSDIVTLAFFDELGNTTTVRSPIELLSPVNQPVRMGKQYTLPEETQVLGTSTAQMVIAKSSDAPKTLGTTSPTPTANGALTVFYPAQNAVLSVGSPLIKGRASAHAIILVSIRGAGSTTTSLNRTTSADKDGAWKLSLTQLLPVGNYSLSVKTEGSITSINRQFTVTQSGERVLGEATASAQLTATPTVTLTSTPTPRDEPQPTLPQTGTTQDYLIYSSAAFIIMGLGLLFLF